MSRIIERCLWLVCLLMLGVFVIGRIGATQAAERTVEAFEQRKQEVRADATLLRAPAPDQSDWSSARIAAFASDAGAGEADAVLRIPALDVAAPIVSGTDEATLNVAVGRVTWSAQVGEAGNLVLAGHRDSFFRRLGQLKEGDRLVVETLDGAWHYEVSGTQIVEPGDVDAVPWTQDRMITLITCYPFYFAGPAPQRFLVFGRPLTDQAYFSSKVFSTGDER